MLAIGDITVVNAMSNLFKKYFMIKRSYSMKAKILFICVFLVLSIPTIASDSNTINTSNWLYHPAIKEIRAIYNEIEAKIKNKDLIEEKKEYEYSMPYVPTLKKIYYDTYKKVRKYSEEAGSDDSSLLFSYYYDSKQVLRFVYITGGAINGTKIEHRIYFNAKGNKIWEIQSLIQGPGYTFPKEWAENELIRDPWKRFNENVQ